MKYKISDIHLNAKVDTAFWTLKFNDLDRVRTAPNYFKFHRKTL